MGWVGVGGGYDVDDGLHTQHIGQPTFPSKSTVPTPTYLADHRVLMLEKCHTIYATF